MDQNSKTILIVDDDRLVLTTVADSLKHAGFNIISCQSGINAIEKINTPDAIIDLALIDICMPVMTGLEFANRLVTEFKIPFMIFSAYSDDEKIASAVAMGALGYLTKPLDISQILPAIHTALKLAEELSKLKQSEQNLSQALQADRAVSIAMGILMERYHLNRDNAFTTLRKSSRDQRRKIADVSNSVVNAVEIMQKIGKPENLS